MTKDYLERILVDKGFMLLHQDWDTAFYRKVHRNSKFKMYIEVAFSGENVVSINKKKPGDILSKL